MLLHSKLVVFLFKTPKAATTQSPSITNSYNSSTSTMYPHLGFIHYTLITSTLQTHNNKLKQIEV